MSKITKKQLHNGWHCHDIEIIKMKKELRELKQSMLRSEKLTDEKLLDEPQLKQLDQSIFDGIDEKWRFASVDKCGEAYVYVSEPRAEAAYFVGGNGTDYWLFGQGYDASSWQNSLIERDIAKEPAEVDLSSELTGSDYFYSNITSALLESGSKLVVCFVSDISELKALSNKRIEVITSLDTSFNDSDGYGWQYAIPINNQGEPLTASEVGL